MRTIIALLLISNCALAQSVSPYLNGDESIVPTAQQSKVTQMTYFDMMWVSFCLQDFMDYEMNMSLQENSWEGDQKTMRFIDEAGSYDPSKHYLQFTFNTVKFEKPHSVITDVEITGHTPYVIEFYIRYWPSTVRPGQGEELVRSNLLQDQIFLTIEDGQAKIKITNTTEDKEALLASIREKYKKAAN